MKNIKFKKRNIFLIGILAIAGIFTFGGIVANELINNDDSFREVEAATTSANNIYLYMEDQNTKYTAYSRDPKVHIWNISISDDCALSASDAVTNAGGTTSDSGATADFSMTWIDGDDNSYKHWYVEFPWYITGFDYCYYNIKPTYTANKTGITAPYSSIDYIWGSFDWNNPPDKMNCSYTGSSTHTKSTTTYTLSFNSNGGSSVSSQTLKEYQKTVKPSNPTKTGYTFSKWTETNSASADEYSFGSYISANKTLYAQWTAKQYTVTLSAPDATNSPTPSVSATYNSAMPSIAKLPTRPGYNFTGYFTASSGGTQYYGSDGSSLRNYTTAGTMTLHAQWEAVPTYTLTGTVDSGSTGYGTVSSAISGINSGTAYTISSNTITVGGSTLTATPTADTAQYDYEFSKWTDTSGTTLSNGTITGDLTVKAWFTRTVKKYAVTFTTGSGVTSIYLSTNSDGSGTQYSSGKTFDYGTTVYVFGTLRQGWAKQDSWTLKNEGTRLYLLNTVTTNSAQALGTISAKTVTYTITYNTNGGSAISSTTYTISGSNQNKSLTAATGKDGFTFSTYTITTNTSGATSSISSKTTLAIPANAYGNIVVRADWSANEYTITFYQNDGSEYYTTDTKTGGAAYTIPTPAAQGMGASGGRHFLRWNTASDGSGTNYVPGASYTTNDDLDLYMIQDWCTYEFSIDGGSHWYGMTRKEEGVTSGYATEYYNTSAIFLTTGDEITFRRSYGGGTPYDIGGTLGFENNYDENGVIVSGSCTFYLKITSDGNNVCYVPGSKTDFCIVIVRDETNLFFTTSPYDGQYVSGFIDIQIGDVVKGYHNGTSTIYSVSLNEYSQGHWSSTGPTATVSGVYKFYLQNTGSSQYNRVYIAMDAQASAVFFAQTFNSSIGGICHMDGSTNKASLTSAWGLNDEVGLCKSYSLLTDEAKEYIDDESENEDIQAFFAKYDYVLGKYGTSVVGNFLGRSVSPKSAYRDFSLSGLFGEGESGLSTVIIIVSSSVALLSVTALSILVIKKRKNKEE